MVIHLQRIKTRLTPRIRNLWEFTMSEITVYVSEFIKEPCRQLEIRYKEKWHVYFQFKNDKELREGLEESLNYLIKHMKEPPCAK